MPRKRGEPSPGELVIGRITTINPNSAFAQLPEYGNIEGMIHISEVASGWVRDIRRFVKPDQEIVGVVIKSDPLSLSLKRVNPNQRAHKLKEYGLEKRAEKMLEMAAQKLGKTLEQAYEDVGFKLQERFGTLYAAFENTLTAPAKIQKIVSREWFDIISEIAQKSIEQKEFELKANLKIVSMRPDGIKVIKSILKKAEKMKMSVHYIAAPNYLVKMITKDPKKGLRDFNEKLEKLASGESGVEYTFEVLE